MFNEFKTFVPFRSGYRPAYHQHEPNSCPGCGKSHWLLGRVSAECAYCGTALPLAEGGRWTATHRPTRLAA